LKVPAEGVRIGLVQLRVGHAFHDPEVALAKPRIGRHFVSRHGANPFRGLQRAAQVARDDRVEGFTRKTSADRIGLSETHVGELAVAVALDARLEIPTRLAVAHDDEAGQGEWIPAFAGMTAIASM